MIPGQKIVLSFGAFILLLATAFASWFMQPAFFLAPVLFLGSYYLIQYPVVAFCVLLFSIPWSVEYNFPSGLGTDLPDEPFMLLTGFSSLLLLIFHRKKYLHWKKIHLLILLLLLKVLWISITVAGSPYFILSAKYLLAKTWYLMAFVLAPLLLWQDEKVLKRSVIILFTSMLLVTAVILVRHGITNFTFSTINDALKPFFRNHVNYSALLVFMIPMQVVFWQETKSKNLRLLILISFAITLPALYLSFARGAWLALVIGLIAYWLIRKKWLFHCFILFTIMAFAMVFWLANNNRYLQFAHKYQSTIFHTNFNQHLAATYQLKDLSTAERFYRWIAGVKMVEDSWQTGFGPTTFYGHYKSYTVPAFKTWVSKNEEKSTVHNYFLLLLVEQGIIGLLLFLILIGTLFWTAQKIYHRTENLFWKRTVAAVASILVMQCTLNFLSDLIETDKVGSVFYLCIAALIIADKNTKAKDVNVALNNHKP